MLGKGSVSAEGKTETGVNQDQMSRDQVETGKSYAITGNKYLEMPFKVELDVFVRGVMLYRLSISKN